MSPLVLESTAQDCFLKALFRSHCSFAYVEFADKDSVVTAQALDESLFRGRQIKVTSFHIDLLDNKQ